MVRYDTFCLLSKKPITRNTREKVVVSIIDLILTQSTQNKQTLKARLYILQNNRESAQFLLLFTQNKLFVCLS
jgi:flavoprotein